MSKRIEVPLRWGDMDAQGHVNNSRFVDYLQEARADLLLSSDVPHLLGGGLVVVSQQIEYLAPIVFSEQPVLVDVSVVECRGAQFVLAYELHHGGRLCARARTRLCPYDFDAGSPRRLTPEERASLTGALEEVEPFRDLTRLPVDERAFSTPLRVRWSDLDAYGHVNNVQIFEYVQEGRIAFSTAADEAMRRVSAGAGRNLWLVVRQDVEYRKQLDFRPEPYAVRVGVAHTGRTSLVFCSDVVDPGSGAVYATAATVLVCGDLEGRPVPLPEEWKDALKTYRLD